MEARRVLLVALVAAVLILQPVHGRSGPSAGNSLPIGLGFSQGTVSPVSSGVPVYTVGDQMWFRTYSAGTVNVSLFQSGGSGDGEIFSLAQNIPGNTTVAIITFSNIDPTGLWTLVASTSAKTASIQFYVLSGDAPTSLSGYGVTGDGQMQATYTFYSAFYPTPYSPSNSTFYSTSVYDLSACPAANQSSTEVSVAVPASLGGGSLSVGLNGSRVTVVPSGTSGSFEFSIALSQDYSYQVNDSSTVLTKTVAVAQTAPVQVSSSGGEAFSTALEDLVPMRIGEFTLSANFQSSQGGSAYKTQVLVAEQGSWVWLQGCSSAASPISNSVTLTTSLRASPSSWPRYVYLLYHQLGVGLFSLVPLTVHPAVVQLQASGWSSPLTDDQIAVSGGQQYAVGNGAVYLVSTHYPMNLSLTIPHAPPQKLGVAQPYTVTSVDVPADRIAVTTSSGGAPVSGATVSLNDKNGTVAAAVSADGEADFFVPPGNYTVEGSSGSGTATAQVTAAGGPGGGQSVDVSLQFGAGDNPTLVNGLIAALAVGAAANIAVWAIAYRRRVPRKIGKPNIAQKIG